MARRKIENMFKADSNRARLTQKGNAGYDNARENIDPHLRTKAVDTKEIVQDGVHYTLSGLRKKYDVVVDAAGNGDYTIIQNGINAMPATGGIVKINPGTYNITSSITFPHDNIMVVGSGDATLIETGNNITMIDTNGKDNIIIKHVKLYDSDVGNTTLGVFINGSDGCIINSVHIRNLKNSVKVTGISNNVQVIISGGHGSAVTQILLLNADYNIIRENYMPIFTAYGIKLENSDKNLIIDNYVIGAGYGIHLDANCVLNAVTTNALLSISITAITDLGTDTQLGHNITS